MIRDESNNQTLDHTWLSQEERARDVIVDINGKEYVYVRIPSQKDDFTGAPYQELGRMMLQAGLSLPTGKYTAPLVHATFNDLAKYNGVLDQLFHQFLYVFNRNLFVPEGMYSIDDLEAKGEKEFPTPSQLERRLREGRELKGVLFSKDGTVRFAPKETYDKGERIREEVINDSSGKVVCTLVEYVPESIANDGQIIAQYGIEGAQMYEDITKLESNVINRVIIRCFELKPQERPHIDVSSVKEKRGELLLSSITSDGSNMIGWGYRVNDRGTK